MLITKLSVALISPLKLVYDVPETTLSKMFSTISANRCVFPDNISCCFCLLAVAPAAVMCIRPRLCVAILNSSHHWYDPPSNSLVLALNSTLTRSIVRRQPVLVWILKRKREEIWNRIQNKRRKKKDDLTSAFQDAPSVGFRFARRLLIQAQIFV